MARGPPTPGVVMVDTATEDMAATAMADTVDTTVDTTARGPLMLRPMPTLTLGAVAMEAVADTAATTARGPLMPGATAVTEATTADTATATATASKLKPL